MTDAAPHPTVQIGYTNFVDALFLREALDARLLAVRGANWSSAVSVGDCGLEPLGSASYDYNACDEALVRVDSGIAHIIQRERAVTVRIAASTEAETRRIEDALRVALPPARSAHVSGEVQIRIWLSQPQRPADVIARTIAAPPWAGIARNYANAVQERIGALMSLRPPFSGGRLIVFHGPPGTGKTHATLSLAEAWQDWLDLEIISDPERFFGSAGYLLDVITRGRAKRSTKERWQLILVEDAGEFLTPFAKAENGQSLSRLLNLADGVLGRSAKTLILATTNEPIEQLHEAVVRPGRCLASIPFTALSCREIEQWCVNHEVTAPTRETMTLAELYAVANPSCLPTAAEASFGFAA